MSYVPAAAIALTGQDAILQGATYHRILTLKDASAVAIDLSAFVGSSKGVRCQMRDGNNGAAIVATPTVSILSGGSTGLIDFLLTSTVTTALGSVASGVFDVEVFDGTVSPPLVERVVNGTWELSLEVTR